MDINKIVEETLDLLIDGNIPESINLDYKREIHFTSKGNKKELCKDISSFANTRGGLLIIGIETNNNDEPIAKVPQLRTKNKQKDIIEQILNSGISPKISGIEIKEIQSKDFNDKFFYILKIPQSVYGHMVTVGSDNRYYKRFNFQIVAMLDYELEEIFKYRLELQSKQLETAERKHQELTNFKLRGKGLSIILQPIIKEQKLVEIDQLTNIILKLDRFGIPISTTNRDTSSGTIYYRDDLGIMGLSVDGTILYRFEYAEDKHEREEHIALSLVTSSLRRSLKSAFKFYSMPEINYNGGLLIYLVIEDAIGRKLNVNPLRRIDSTVCKQDSVIIKNIQNNINSIDIKDILESAVKELMMNFGILPNYSTDFLRSESS